MHEHTARITEGRGTGLPANATLVEKEEAGNQVNLLLRSKLGELVEFSNQAGNQASVGASDQAKRILNDAVHDKVVEILIYLKIPQARADGVEFLMIFGVSCYH